MAIWGTKKRDFQEKARIVNLKKGIASLGKVPDEKGKILPYAVNFFEIVAKFQDGGKIELQHDAKWQYKLNHNIDECGRDLKGVNRTQKGERVTLEKLHLEHIDNVQEFLNFNMKNITKACNYLLGRC